MILNMSENKDIVIRGLSGLNNLGNTCYMNATIEFLSCTGLFAAYLIKKELKTEINFNNDEFSQDIINNLKTNNYCMFVKLQAKLAWIANIKKIFSIITELFTGLFCSSIICKECKQETFKFEIFNILQIPI